MSLILSLKLIKSRWHKFLKYSVPLKHILIVLTVLISVIDMVRYPKYCNGCHPYCDSATNTTTTSQFKNVGFDEHMTEKLPLFYCNVYIMAEAVYNLIFLVIICKDVYKVYSIFSNLEFLLFFTSAFIKVGIHKTIHRTSYECFLYSFYMMILFYHHLNLKLENEEKRRRNSRIRVVVEPRIASACLAA